MDRGERPGDPTVKQYRSGISAFSLAVLLAGVPHGASAADYDAAILQNAGVTPVEYGSGWYLRGDIGGSFKVDGDMTFFSIARTSFDDQSFGSALSYGVGGGYIFNDYFRADVTLDYNTGMDWQGTSTISACGLVACFSEEDASYDRLTLHANAYVALGRWAGFSPYVGAGLGVSHLDWTDYNSTVAGVVTPYATNSEVSFSYALMAGFDIALSEKWKLDLGYKYTQVQGGVVAPANPGGVISPLGDIRFDDLAIHEVRVGLRYEIW